MTELNKIYHTLLHELDLGEAIREMRQFMDKHMLTANDLFTSVEEEYGLMQDYMLRGYEDPQREQVYQRLMLRLFNALHRLHADYLVRSAQAFGMMRRTAGASLSADDVKQRLEAFVQEGAMIGLEGDADGQKRRRLYATHQQFMDRLFCSIMLSDAWTQDDRFFYRDLMVSPTIDQNDALLICSAIGLAALTIPDPQKMLCLLSTYQRSDDVRLQNRALIGWTFALPKEPSPLLEELNTAIAQASAKAQSRYDIVELQKQFFYCLTAESDYKYLEENVIPGLIKDSNFRVTRFGIQEKEDDPMEDILDPDAGDKRMERVEKSMRHLMDMQKEGADIYFGGFSKMKRSPFFSTLSNWFYPFTLDHPGMDQVRDFAEQSKFLTYILEKGPFCDSDKYSFVLTTTPIIGRLSEQMKEVFNTADNMEEMMIHSDDMQSPEYARRSYLQDLYRFFRLNPYRKDFNNPFEIADDDPRPRIFCLSRLLRIKTEDYVSIARQLLRLKLYGPMQELSLGFDDENSVDWQLLIGRYEQRCRNYSQAIGHYQTALVLEPENEAALKGHAFSAFYSGKLRESLESYTRLVDLHPDDAQLLQCLAICEMQCGKQQEGLQRLARLRYEHPESQPIKRSQAWAYLVSNQPDKAEPLYDSLLSQDPQEPNDQLNAAYCKWALRKRFEAVSLLQNSMKRDAKPEEQIEALRQSFNDDRDLLAALGMTVLDQKLMTDMAVRSN